MGTVHPGFAQDDSKEGVQNAGGAAAGALSAAGMM